MTVREGWCWFVMDLMSFDLSVEVVGGEVKRHYRGKRKRSLNLD